MTASATKEKSGDNTKHNSSTKSSPEKSTVVPSNRSTESMSASSGNKPHKISSSAQNNTFKVRTDTAFYTGTTPTTTDIPIFREEFLEHNKVLMYLNRLLWIFLPNASVLYAYVYQLC